MHAERPHPNDAGPAATAPQGSILRGSPALSSRSGRTVVVDHLTEDADLVEALRTSNVEALHELYRRHGAAVYAAAIVCSRRITGTAEDLTANAFVSLFRQPPAPGRSARSELLRRVGRTARECTSTPAARA